MTEPLFDNFPREMGLPHRIGTVKNREEFQDVIENNIYSKNVYTTIYGFRETAGNKPVYKTAIVNKLFFDYDPEEVLDDKNCAEDALKQAEWLLEQDLKFTIVFSGGGVHIYVKTVEHNGENKLTNPKTAVANAQEEIADQAGVMQTSELDEEDKDFFEGKYVFLDDQIIGDIARITRVPNTYNYKDNRDRWCVPITLGELREAATKKDLSVLYEIAEEQREGIEWYGNKILDLERFDGEREIRTNQGEIKTSQDFKPNMGRDAEEVELTPCLQKILDKGDPNFHQRFALIVYLKEMGVSYESAIDFLEENMFEEKFRHARDEAGRGGTPEYIFRKDYLLPDKNWMIDKGICSADCSCSYEHVYETDDIFKDNSGNNPDELNKEAKENQDIKVIE